MQNLIVIFPVAIAAAMVGNWFLKEVRKANAQKAPWYTPYFSIPGILILLALGLPVLIWCIRALR